MSSKPIYPHVPYFYIIEHVASGKRYAGSRWAKGCNPAEFMKPNGYCTSSKLVKKIIEEEGIDAFRVISIKTVDEIGDVYDYETKFLVENDCAKSNIWFNMHNNAIITTGTEEYKNAMVKKYGVDNAMKSTDIKERARLSLQEKYGVDNPMKSPVVKEQVRTTLQKKYGVDHYSHTKEFKEKCQATYLERLGVDNPMKSDNIKEKGRQTHLAKRGVDHHNKTEEHRKRLSEAAKIQRANAPIQTCPVCGHQGSGPTMAYRHFENCGNPEIIRQQSENAKRQRANEPVVECPHCGLTGKGPNMKRYHFDKCRHKLSE